MGIPAPIGVSAAGLPPSGDQANAVLSGAFAAIGVSQPFAVLGPMNLVIFASVVTTLTTTAGSLAATVASGTGMAAGTAINGVNVPRGATWGAFAGVAGTLALPALTYGALAMSVDSFDIELPPGAATAPLVGATVSVASNVQPVVIPAGTTVTAVARASVAPSLNSPGVSGIVTLSNKPTTVPNINPAVQPQPLVFGLGAAAVLGGADAAAAFTGAGITYSGSVQLERSFDGGATWLLCNIGGSGALAQYAAGTPVSLVFGEPERSVLYRLNCTGYTSGVINYRLSTTGQAATSLSIGSAI